MATDATLSVITAAQLGNKGLVVTIKKDGNIFGHLMVGKASLVWFEKNAKRQGRKISWDQFHTWVMQQPEVSATRP